LGSAEVVEDRFFPSFELPSPWNNAWPKDPGVKTFFGTAFLVSRLDVVPFPTFFFSAWTSATSE
jgi:hypothetical protein